MSTIAGFSAWSATAYGDDGEVMISSMRWRFASNDLSGTWLGRGGRTQSFVPTQWQGGNCTRTKGFGSSPNQIVMSLMGLIG